MSSKLVTHSGEFIVVRTPTGGSIDYLPGEQCFVTAKAEQPFDMRNLYRASGLSADDFVGLAAAGTTAETDQSEASAPAAVEGSPNLIEFIMRHTLWDAVKAASAASQAVFGTDTGYEFQLDLDDDEETALQMKVIVTAAGLDVDELVERQNDFIRRYIESVRPVDRKLIHLSVATDE